MDKAIYVGLGSLSALVFAFLNDPGLALAGIVTGLLFKWEIDNEHR